MWVMRSAIKPVGTNPVGRNWVRTTMISFVEISITTASKMMCGTVHRTGINRHKTEGTVP
jgi:hypothetical protein